MKRQSLGEAHAFVTRMFEKFEVKENIHRFQEYAVLMKKNPGYIPSTIPDFSRALELFKDIMMFEFIFDQLQPALTRDPRYPDIEVLKRKVQLAVKDAATEVHSKGNAGRDTQTELYAAALAAAARRFPVKMEDRDVLCQFDGMDVIIEAKRVSRVLDPEELKLQFLPPKRIINTITKAVTQVKKSGKFGIVLADLSVAVNPSNQKFLAAFGARETSERRFAHLRSQVYGPVVEGIETTLAGSTVVGVLFTETQMVQSNEGVWEMSGTSMIYENSKGKVSRADAVRWMRKLTDKVGANEYIED